MYFDGDALKSSMSGLKARPINAIFGFPLFFNSNRNLTLWTFSTHQKDL